MSTQTFWRYIVVFAIVGGSLVGGVAGHYASDPLIAGGARGPAAAVESSYTEALGVVSGSYVEDVDYEKATQAAIQGMLLSLDPHSNYFTKADYERLRQDQESRFPGIGVSITRHRDGVYVQSAVPGTPAARAGLRFGDLIAEVDGENAREWTTAQVARKVRGPRGQTVRLTVERAGSPVPLYFSITREEVDKPSVPDAYMLRPGVGYIALSDQFTRTTAEEVRARLSELRGQGMRQLVFDLRDNPGGLLDQAIAVASLFIERGKTIVTVRGRPDERERVFRNVGTDPVDYPLVVLINRGSASASEIVAGAIQDHGRGLLVGETSFGKGLVQRIFDLPGGAGLTLTTAKYYTPFGRLIQRGYTSGSYYDYVTRHGEGDDGEGDAAAPPQPQGPAITAAGGRVFYGGGGITPDYFVKPPDATTPVRARVYEASFHFTRRLAAGLVPGLEGYRVPEETQYGRHPRPTDYPVTDRVFEAFRDFVARDAGFGLSPAQVEAERDYARLRLRDDIVTAAYGAEAGQRALLEGDPQLLRALELLPEARQLAENIGRGGAVN